jgi:hypothetical protein
MNSSTHVKISQLVNNMCSQQTCSKLVDKLEQWQCCYFIKLLQGCHSQLVDKLLNCRTITTKLLEQLVTSLLSSTTLQQVVTHNLSTICVRNRLVASLSTSWNNGNAVILSSCYKVVTHNLLTSC